MLSFKFFTPLARVTYGTYLIHFNIEYIFAIVFPQFFYFDFWSLAILAAGIIVISYVISFVISLLIESPIVGILKKYIGSE